MASSELKWLGYFLVREGVLEPDQVRDLKDGDDIDYVDYAQRLIDSNLCEDYELLQTLVDQSFSKGQEDEDPPVNIFKQPEPPPAEPEETEHSAAELPVAQPSEQPDTSSAKRPPIRLRMSGSDTKPRGKSSSGPVLADQDDDQGSSLKPLGKKSSSSKTSGTHRRPPAPKGAAVPLSPRNPEQTAIVDGRDRPPKPASSEQEPDQKPVRQKLSLKSSSDSETPTDAARPALAAQQPPAPQPPAESHDAPPPQSPPNKKSLAQKSDVSMPDMNAVLSGGTVPSVNSAIGKSPAEAGIILARILVGVRAHGASDLHISAGARPFFRKSMQNQFLEDELVDPRAAEALNLALLSTEQRQELEAELDLDYALALDDDNRFRVNLMYHRDGLAGSYRLVPNGVSALEELGFRSCETIESMLSHHNGLILVTGPVGSGKTTTLAALVNILNHEREDHIITVEDPIEIVQRSDQCNITQREVGKHTRSFFTALKGALREDPDIIVIGELRDLETIEMAITAAETGHLVIGTLHTSDASTTLNRILDVFPPSQQAQIRSMTAESLRGIVCQRLLPTVDGGVTVAEELLVSTIAVGNIIREGKMHQLRAVLETGSSLGMRLMDQSVQDLYLEGVISKEIAFANIGDLNMKQRLEQGQGPAAKQSQGAAAEAAPKKKKGWFK